LACAQAGEARYKLGSMNGSFVIRGVAYVTLLLATAGPSRASAFCRESVMSEPSGPCEESPDFPLLHWTRDCLTYVFNDQLFSRLLPLTEAEIRSTFNTSFQTWADVDCSGRAPFFVDQTNAATKTSKAEFVYDEPNESVIVARLRSEWAALPNHDPTALAFTLLWHDKNTGEILDVDMELNTGAGKFANCERDRCGGMMVDLQNTITHEAGHLLGLGHTTVRGATMTTTAIGAETEKRSLEADDKAGYCALDLPEFECSDSQCMCPTPEAYRSEPEKRSCSCRAVGSTAPVAPLAFFAPVALVFAGLRVRARSRNRARRAAAQRA
jgi:Matrixin